MRQHQISDLAKSRAALQIEGCQKWQPSICNAASVKNVKESELLAVFLTLLGYKDKKTFKKT